MGPSPFASQRDRAHALSHISMYALAEAKTLFSARPSLPLGSSTFAGVLEHVGDETVLGQSVAVEVEASPPHDVGFERVRVARLAALRRAAVGPARLGRVADGIRLRIELVSIAVEEHVEELRSGARTAARPQVAGARVLAEARTHAPDHGVVGRDANRAQPPHARVRGQEGHGEGLRRARGKSFLKGRPLSWPGK